jgi:hypothetical protein
MSKSKQEELREDRTKRAHRDSVTQDREKSWRPTDENFNDSDGTVDEEMEFDTSKYEVPRSR